ncbi:MAG: biopolymer transporter ExbD [Pseudomonadota bacterium]
MSLRRARRRRRASITSLIDVIFLLLLFFMLSSTFSRFSELTVASVSQSDVVSPSAKSSVVSLNILPSAMSLNGQVVADEDLLQTLRRTLITQDRLSVSVSDTVSTQRLIETLVVLSALEGMSVQLLEPK